MTLAKEPAHDEAAATGSNRVDDMVLTKVVSNEATHVWDARIQKRGSRM